MRSQLERLFPLIYRRERRCLDCFENLKKGNDGKARLSPEEAAEELFRKETPEDQLLCFLLLVSLGNELAASIVTDLGRRGDGAISVDEALLIAGDELDKLCEYSRTRTIKLIESSRQRKVIKIKEIT